MINSFLIVGFGGMGSRHAQSLINSYSDSLVYIYEPNDDVYRQNLNLIGQSVNKNIQRLYNLNEIKFKIDFCVIATSSGPRFEILRELLNYDIPYFLVEKVVFQTDSQFQEIQKLMGGKRIYVNFVNRYFQNYIDLKQDINNRSFSMDIIGGDFGLSCNALHYFDLFKYFGSIEPTLSKFNLKENTNGNKRGNIYKEVEGQISILGKEESVLNISSDLKRQGDVEIVIKYANKTHIINEGLSKHIQFSGNNIITKPLLIQYTSSLTAIMYKDILESNCLLPVINDTRDIHTILFESINKSLKLKTKDVCPVT
jgi:hypothetical protein